MDEDGVIAGQVAYPVEVEFYAAAEDLGKARAAWAQKFLLYRTKAETDKQAAARADADMAVDLARLEAVLEIAKRRLTT